MRPLFHGMYVENGVAKHNFEGYVAAGMPGRFYMGKAANIVDEARSALADAIECFVTHPEPDMQLREIARRFTALHDHYSIEEMPPFVNRIPRRKMPPLTAPFLTSEDW